MSVLDGSILSGLGGLFAVREDVCAIVADDAELGCCRVGRSIELFILSLHLVPSADFIGQAIRTSAQAGSRAPLFELSSRRSTLALLFRLRIVPRSKTKTAFRQLWLMRLKCASRLEFRFPPPPIPDIRGAMRNPILVIIVLAGAGILSGCKSVEEAPVSVTSDDRADQISAQPLQKPKEKETGFGFLRSKEDVQAANAETPEPASFAVEDTKISGGEKHLSEARLHYELGDYDFALESLDKIGSSSGSYAEAQALRKRIRR
jgi:hypothetical protein